MRDWRLAPLGSHCDVQNGYPFSSEFFDESEGTPLIRVRSLKTHSCDKRIKGSYDESFLVQNGSVLIGMDGDFQPCLWQGGDALLNQRVCRLWNFSNELDPCFAYFALKEPLRKLEEVTHYTTVKHLSSTTIKNIEIVLPPLPEQRAIAHVLATVQQAKETRQRELALERERKAALMEHLFTYGTRGKNVPENGITFPSGWKLVHAGELIAEGPQNGIYKHLDSYGSGTPILRINDFNNDGMLVSESLSRLRLAQEEIMLYQISIGDILINRVNSLSHLGKSLLVREVKEPTVFESNMMRLRVDASKVLPGYFRRHLLTEQTRNYIRGRAKRAVAQSSVSQGDVRSIPISLPPIPEQEEIEGILEACDKKQSSTRRELALLQELFDSTLPKLMSSEISTAPLIERKQAQ
jgi:type I restriction enzyme S subunit